MDRNRWGKLMFDDSFQLSEQYFTVLQLLRIFQNWIAETERGIRSLGEEYGPLTFSIPRKSEPSACASVMPDLFDDSNTDF